MNKQELIKRYNYFIKKEKLTNEQAWVGSGGTLLLLGLRSSTQDIDLGVPKDIFDKIRSRGLPEHVLSGDTVVIEYDEFINIQIEHGHEEHIIIDGVGSWTVQEVLRLKERLNRPKDQEDIKKIKEYLIKKQSYQEGQESTAGSEGKLYQLDTLFKLVENRKPTTIKVSDLQWVLKYTEVDEKRIASIIDLSTPLLVYKSEKTGQYITLDGAHRLTKAVREKVKELPVYFLSHQDLKKAEIPLANNVFKAIIIKGNPKYINNDLARKYYKDIQTFLIKHGVTQVEFDNGDAYTIPSLDADLYIAHSRGCSRYNFMPKEKQNVFLKLGVPDGIIDPIDLKWQNEVWFKDTDEQPPKEHFVFNSKQKEAVLKLINQAKNTKKISQESLSNIIFKW